MAHGHHHGHAPYGSGVRQLTLEPALTLEIPPADVELAGLLVGALQLDTYAPQLAADTVALRPVEQRVADVAAAVGGRHHKLVEHQRVAVLGDGGIPRGPALALGHEHRIRIQL